MAISKRLRFEVFKRDNFTCTYCRSKNNEITIDHVMPVALGGLDTPENLVTACIDCNAGKTSTAPNSDLVSDTSKNAAAQTEAFKEELKKATADALQREKFADEFFEQWESIREEYGLSWASLDDRDDWETSVIRWRELGVSPELFEANIRVAMRARHVPQRSRFRYFCAVMHNQLKEAFNKSVEDRQ